MRIAFVSDVAFPWHAGGVEQTERLEAEALAKKNEVHFFSFMWKGMKEDFVDKRIHYHCSYGITEEQFYRHKRRSMREAFRFSLFSWRIFSDRFDVVQANAFPYLHLPVIRFYCALFHSKYVVDVAEAWGRERWASYLGPLLGGLMWHYANWALADADAYIVNPGDTYEGLVALGVERSKIHTFTPILDDGEISKVGAPQKSGPVVYLGRLIKEKRFDRWLDVIKEASAKYPKIKAVIAGEGPERESISHMISALGLGKTVTLKRRIPTRKDAYKFLKGASMFLNMSEREGLSATSLECLALGTPVVLPSYSPIPEPVKDMCVVDDKDSLADVVVRIAKSKRKSSFIKNIKNLESFKASGIASFYDRLLEGLR